MRALVVLPASIVTSFLLAFAASADEPEAKQEPEKLPAPKVKASEYYYIPARPIRWDTREAWIFLATDQNGRFRPRVITSPEGSYYLYDGRPYLFSPQPRQVLPRTTD